MNLFLPWTFQSAPWADGDALAFILDSRKRPIGMVASASHAEAICRAVNEPSGSTTAEQSHRQLSLAVSGVLNSIDELKTDLTMCRVTLERLQPKETADAAPF